MHYESIGWLNTSPERAFAFLDDFEQLSAHMRKRAAMMLGSRMSIGTDLLRGRAPGSKVRMEGRVLGISLFLEEVVTERDPPWRKVWETVDARLLVIGQYRLGFCLTGMGEGCQLRVFIDYEPPAGSTRWLGRLFGQAYARWCTERMISDAVRNFAM